MACPVVDLAPARRVAVAASPAPRLVWWTEPATRWIGKVHIPAPSPFGAAGEERRRWGHRSRHRERPLRAASLLRRGARGGGQAAFRRDGHGGLTPRGGRAQVASTPIASPTEWRSPKGFRDDAWTPPLRHGKLPGAMAVLKTGDTFRRRLRWLAVAICLLLATYVATSGCQIVGHYESFQGHPCNALPSSKPDPKTLATLVLSKQTDGTCYWIDQTEVTVQQYSAFLADQSGSVSWDPACAWKTTPSNPITETSDLCTVSTNVESEPFRATKPIRCVDWCDARAFCHWAGKDLCSGNAADGIVTPQDLPDQWGGACSANGLSYVNGSRPVYGECNVGLDAGQCLAILHQYSCASADVDSFPECTGPCGTVDMIGNVAEWVLQCGYSVDGGPGGRDSPCQHRGGSFAGSLVEETCYAVAPDARGTRSREIGLRCCAALTPDEHRLAQ
jgi:formylglycine-generating enzyme required for sulfatase activity